MDIDKWQQLKETLRSKFDVDEEGTEDLITYNNNEQVTKGTADFIVIVTPMGKIKVSFQKKPMVIDKKVHHSHRAGESEYIEYIFSDTEFTYKLHAYKWNENKEDWDEIDAENFK